MKYQIVIDTNVLVSALKSSKGAAYQLLRIIDSGKFEINVSTPLVAEYEEILKREIKHLSKDEIDDVINYVCTVSNKHKIFYLWRPVIKDPDDDLVLEIAVKSGSIIITYNKDDFKRASEFNIRVLTPKEFLKAIGD